MVIKTFANIRCSDLYGSIWMGFLFYCLKDISCTESSPYLFLPLHHKSHIFDSTTVTLIMVNLSLAFVLTGAYWLMQCLLFEFVGTPDVAQSTPGNARIRWQKSTPVIRNQYNHYWGWSYYYWISGRNSKSTGGWCDTPGKPVNHAT